MKVLFALAILALLPPGSCPAGDRFACNIDAFSTGERARYAKVAETLLRAVVEKRELADGYAFRLPARELMTAAEWVSLERRCCPFFAFQLEQSRDEGALWLRVTGPKGVKAFIREEFRL